MVEPLASWVERQLRTDLVRCKPVAGGCIHRAWSLELGDGRRLFVKTNSAAMLPLFEAEAEGLGALAASTDAALRIPAPLFCGLEGERALLAMEWLDLRTSGVGDGWTRLGAGLARLHRRSSSLDPGAFGWGHDNYIGSCLQSNGWWPDWGWFFAERRIRPQFELAAASGGPWQERLRQPIESLLALMPAWLNDHGPLPSLVHGDLWGGNVSLLGSGSESARLGGSACAAVFDPAVYRGDREVDLAMARLFGGFPEPFFNGYEAEWPLAPGHRQRAHLYNLYHLLNHANLFGGGYWQQAEARIWELHKLISAATAD